MTDLYERSDMTVREASNNINRNIVQEDYCDATEVVDGLLLEWQITGEDYLVSSRYCNLDDA